MKNLITLKKFCLVVAIVGLLHTIVDAEIVTIPKLSIGRYDAEKTANLVYNTDFNKATWSLENLLKFSTDPDNYRGWEIWMHGVISNDEFVSTYSYAVVDIFNKHGQVDLKSVGNDKIAKHYRLDNGQVYMICYQKIISTK